MLRTALSPTLTLATLLLAGCTGLGDAGRDAARTTTGCRIEKAADIPLALERGHFIVPARINQSAVRMVVDTGAERTVVTPAVAAHLPSLGGAQSTIVGLGGRIVSRDAVGRIELGGMEVQRRLLVTSLPLRTRGESISGMIGVDLLSDFDVEISLPDQRLRLYSVKGCEGGYVPWQGTWYSVPVRSTWRQRLLVPVQVEGHPLTALLDTGSTATFLEADAARRIGVTAEDLAADPEGGVRGADLNRFGFRRHRFAELRVGTERLAGVSMNVVAFSLPQAGMLLGADFFRGRRVWLSWRTHQMFVQPTHEAVAAPTPEAPLRVPVDSSAGSRTSVGEDVRVLVAEQVELGAGR